MEMHYDSGAQSVLARCVSAEIRARLAARRIAGREFAARLGMSQNYFATRLRDEKPFTLDDVEAIVDAFDADEDEDAFIVTAWQNYSERIWADSDVMRRSAQRRREESEGAEKVDYALAADEDEQTIEAEQESTHET